MVRVMDDDRDDTTADEDEEERESIEAIEARGRTRLDS